MTQGLRRAVIDIGSNSVRLVIFGGAGRAPVVLYNEKLMAGLGRGVLANGRLSDEGQALALAGLERFRLLVEAMDVALVEAVATAAVRDASNGADFMAQVQALGINARILSGEEEAMASGYGVISAIPDADGVVADLGGGSLELVRVRGGEVHDRFSLPFGILGVAEIRAQGPDRLAHHVETLVGERGWAEKGAGLPLYLVGGSWRSLARVHMAQTGFPLTVIGEYTIPAQDAAPLAAHIGAMDKAAIKQVPDMPSARVPMVADAAALLSALVAAMLPSQLITCAFGLREGLLYLALDEATRQSDPLIAGVRFATDDHQAMRGYGDALFAWSNALFGADHPGDARLRHAVCLMRGTGWASNPDFRALGGEELALHGNWVGVSASARAMMGMALYVGLGGKGAPPDILSQLADEAELARARQWGLAIRLAQRLSGGAPALLAASRLAMTGGELTLLLPQALAALQDDVLGRRLSALASALGLDGARIIAT